MQRKLILMMLCVVLVAALAGGATFALFSDEATNSGNTFTAGTVDIAADRDLGDPIPGPMFYTTVAEGLMDGQLPVHLLNESGLWWPGRTVSRNLDIRNLGSLQVRLHQVGATITHINGQPAADFLALRDSFADNMHVKIYVAGHAETMVLYDGSLAGLISAPQTAVHKPLIAPLAPGGWPPIVQLVYEVTMDIDAGNDLQGIVPLVDFSVYAEQTKNN